MVCIVAFQKVSAYVNLLLPALVLVEVQVSYCEGDVMHTCQVKRCNRKVADKYMLCGQHGRQACNAARWHMMVDAAKRELETS